MKLSGAIRRPSAIWPNESALWILKETILVLHDRLIADFGGSPGVRDAGLLDSALARPANLFAYETPAAFELAACYGFGLIQNHPFVDGNKRIGFASAILFLELNGCRLHAEQRDATEKTLALASGTSAESEYAAWIETNAAVA